MRTLLASLRSANKTMKHSNSLGSCTTYTEVVDGEYAVGPDRTLCLKIPSYSETRGFYIHGANHITITSQGDYIHGPVNNAFGAMMEKGTQTYFEVKSNTQQEISLYSIPVVTDYVNYATDKVITDEYGYIILKSSFTGKLSYHVTNTVGGDYVGKRTLFFFVNPNIAKVTTSDINNARITFNEQQVTFPLENNTGKLGTEYTQELDQSKDFDYMGSAKVTFTGKSNDKPLPEKVIEAKYGAIFSDSTPDSSSDIYDYAFIFPSADSIIFGFKTIIIIVVVILFVMIAVGITICCCCCYGTKKAIDHTLSEPLQTI